jgi:hypothetical protein
MSDEYWTYNEWVEATVRKIVGVNVTLEPQDQVGWLDVQIRAAISKSLRHGRSGLSDDDPVTL